jgi:hypothetical protein
MRVPPRGVCLLLLLAAAGACTRAQARVPPPVPGLLTPDPPDRVIVPVTIEVPEPPVAPAPAPANPSRPVTRPERPATTAAAPPPAPAASEPVPPPPVLQTATNPAELERKAKDSIAQAQRDLARVALPQLGANARELYDTAKGFIHQAEDALNIRNVVLAKYLADKAAALAGQLAKR